VLKRRESFADTCTRRTPTTESNQAQDLPDEPPSTPRSQSKNGRARDDDGEGSMRVHTVEHGLAAHLQWGVDNVIVEMDATNHRARRKRGKRM